MPAKAGPAKPVTVVTDNRPAVGPVIPAYGFDASTLDRPVEAGPAQPIVIVTAAEIAAQGLKVDGDPISIPMYAVDDRVVAAGPARLVTVAAGVLGGGAAWTPANLGATLKQWLKADAGLTLSTTPYAGTGTITKSGTAVTGSGTAFTSEIVVGDTLTATGITGTVTAIASATALTMNTSETQAAGQAFTINPTAGATDRVVTAADFSGQANDVTQATASARPAKIPAFQNGLPGILGDGFNDYLRATFPLAQPQTIYYVARVKAAAANAFIFGGVASDRRVYTGVNVHKVYAGAGLANLSVTDGTTGIVRAEFNGASSSARLNNGTPITGNAGTNAGGGVTLFASAVPDLFGNVYLFEFLVCDSILSAANDAAVLAYLNAKWVVF